MVSDYRTDELCTPHRLLNSFHCQLRSFSLDEVLTLLEVVWPSPVLVDPTRFSWLPAIWVEPSVHFAFRLCIVWFWEFCFNRCDFFTSLFAGALLLVMMEICSNDSSNRIFSSSICRAMNADESSKQFIYAKFAFSIFEMYFSSSFWSYPAEYAID